MGNIEKTKFYDRKDLSVRDIVSLIGIWESEAGVSPLSVIYQRDEEYAKQQS